MPEDELERWIGQGTVHDFELMIRFILIDMARRGYDARWLRRWMQRISREHTPGEDEIEEAFDTR